MATSQYEGLQRIIELLSEEMMRLNEMRGEDDESMEASVSESQVFLQIFHMLRALRLADPRRARQDSDADVDNTTQKEIANKFLFCLVAIITDWYLPGCLKETTEILDIEAEFLKMLKSTITKELTALTTHFESASNTMLDCEKADLRVLKQIQEAWKKGTEEATTDSTESKHSAFGTKGKPPKLDRNRITVKIEDSFSFDIAALEEKGDHVVRGFLLREVRHRLSQKEEIAKFFVGEKEWTGPYSQLKALFVENHNRRTDRNFVMYATP